jgi:hypothetical protein
MLIFTYKSPAGIFQIPSSHFQVYLRKLQLLMPAGISKSKVSFLSSSHQLWSIFQSFL